MYSMVRNPNANTGDPQMSRIILYVAASLDGFIARPDGDVSWLDAYQAEGEDYGYRDFLAGVDAIAMGSRSFDQILSFGAWPYGEIPCYVFTKRDLTVPGGVPALLWRGSVEAFREEMECRHARTVWLLGGAALLQSFLRASAVDELRIVVIPLLLGAGIALFGTLGREIPLTLLSTKQYQNGIVEICYAAGEGEA
jgi:dihydrofolate reductase